MQLNLPDSLRGGWKPRRAGQQFPIMVWTPPQARRIRAVMLFCSNTDSMALSAHKPLREVCTRREVGIVYLRFLPFNQMAIKPEGGKSVQDILARDANALQTILNKVADRSGIAEYRHAPWVTQGKSSNGRFPINTMWALPDRVLATITWHGEVPPFAPPPWAGLKDQTVLHINVNGETEWGGTWYRHVRPCLLMYRAKTGVLPHQVVSWGIGHGDYPDETSGKGNPTPRMKRSAVWDYIALWLDKALELRLPPEGYPTTGPIKLKQVDDTDGYCIDARAPEELLQIPYKPLIREADGTYKVNAYNARAPNRGESAEDYEKYYRAANPSAGDEQVRKDVAELMKLQEPKGLKASQLIRKAADVPEAERRKMLWVPDRDTAEAWFKLHAIKGQKFDVP